jgi:SAM-dependent methyltransferase
MGKIKVEVTEQDQREFIAERAAAFGQLWDPHDKIRIEDWFELGWAQRIAPPLPMPAGETLTLGAGYRVIGNSTPLDLEHGWNADEMNIPRGDDSIAGIYAFGFFEHLERPVWCLSECQRVLQLGGVLSIVTPHALADCQQKDLYHKCGFTEETWQNLFDNPYYDNAYPDGKGIEWTFKVHTCFIMGVVWRNLALFTQLVKDG